MGRKRFVTNDISIDGKVSEVAEQNPVAGLMWPWFLTHVDDWARFTGDVREIRNCVFQSFKDHYNRDDLEEVLQLFAKHQLVHRYTVENKPYLQFNPKAFYVLNSYIQKARQKHDGSKLPPPRDHPWGDYWATSDWDDEGQRKVQASDDE